jgi:hypothetical protein
MLDRFYFFAGILMIKKYIMIENILLSHFALLRVTATRIFL